jgi:cytochrome c oxidase subunit 1
MGVAATFAILGALFFWFPKMFGRRLSEPLGRLHFWLTFAGVYCIFMPMHWLGLVAHSRAPAGNSLAAAAEPVRDFITGAIVATIAAQGIFLFNFIRSVWWGAKVNEKNPWRATTLEWSIASPTPFDNFGPAEPVVYRGAYEFGAMGRAEDFVPQHLAPEQVPARIAEQGR